MTELQMGLIGLGAIAVVGVLGYNKWQEVRQRKAAEKAMRAGERHQRGGAALARRPWPGLRQSQALRAMNTAMEH